MFEKAFAVPVNSRYQSLSEFVNDMGSAACQPDDDQPFMFKHPLVFWKGFSVFVFCLGMGVGWMLSEGL